MRPNFTGVKFRLEVPDAGNPADVSIVADLKLEFGYPQS
jgi:hypothetical protein